MRNKILIILNGILLLTSLNIPGHLVYAKDPLPEGCSYTSNGWYKGDCCTKCPFNPNYGARWDFGGTDFSMCKDIDC